MNKKVLIADDNAICEVISHILKKHSINIAFCNSIRILEENWHKFNPDLIIMDVMLAGASGLNFIKRCKECLNNPKPRVLVMSTGEYCNKALYYGADQVIEKPFSIDPFRKMVSTLLQHRDN